MAGESRRAIHRVLAQVGIAASGFTAAELDDALADGVPKLRGRRRAKGISLPERRQLEAAHLRLVLAPRAAREPERDEL